MSSAMLYLIALTFSLKVKDSNLRYFGRSYVILQTMTDMVQVAIAVEWKLYMDFRIAYLYLTWAHYKGQDRVYFDSEYLRNGDRYEKHYYCNQIKVMYWYINI